MVAGAEPDECVAEGGVGLAGEAGFVQAGVASGGVETFLAGGTGWRGGEGGVGDVEGRGGELRGCAFDVVAQVFGAGEEVRECFDDVALLRDGEGGEEGGGRRGEWHFRQRLEDGGGEGRQPYPLPDELRALRDATGDLSDAEAEGDEFAEETALLDGVGLCALGVLDDAEDALCALVELVVDGRGDGGESGLLCGVEAASAEDEAVVVGAVLDDGDGREEAVDRDGSDEFVVGVAGVPGGDADGVEGDVAGGGGVRVLGCALHFVGSPSE